MIKNYLVVAARTFWAHKLISFIHIIGLSIGISAALIIFLIIKFELGFNNVSDADRIHRVVMNVSFNNTPGYSSAVPAPLANAIDQEVSGVEATIPIMTFQGDGTAKVTVDTQAKPVIFKNQSQIAFTSPDYFRVMEYNWITGDQPTALREPFSVVLTKTRARLYFPNINIQEVIGRQLVYNENLTVTITGIVDDFTHPTDLALKEFISYSTISKTNLQQNFMMDVWTDWMAYSSLYLKLSPATDVAAVERQLKTLLNKYNENANKQPGNSMAFALQPLSDVHFNPNYIGFNQRIANKKTLFGLSAIASFLLFLACINFINLSTARATRRGKEIGIRKTVGSSKKHLMLQFLSETFCITSIAALVSLSLVPVLLTLFSEFIPEGLSFSLSQDPVVLLFVMGLVVLITFLSGFYPAMVLSAFRPRDVLKNQFKGRSIGSTGFRKALIISQFVIAQFFIIVTIIVTKQIQFSINQDLGYRKEAIINFATPREPEADHREQLRREIEQIAGVEKVSLGFLPPAIEGAAFGNISYKQADGELIKLNAQIRWGDPGYLDVYHISLAAGRNIRPGKDVKEVLINEQYAYELGITSPEKAIDEEVIMGDGSSWTIVGVMKNFHERSTRGKIGPIVFRANESGNFFHVALLPQATGTLWQTSLEKIQQAFSRIYPEHEFTYSFFDETIAEFYKEEQRMATLLNGAMVLSILISCLGLLGLVIFTAETRTKEIGIRKILGASVANIVSILSLDFVKLVVIAFIIAAPIAWYTMDQWLNGFAYRTQMSWWVFVSGGLILVLIALITMSVQTVKTATENPVRSLRSE